MTQTSPQQPNQEKNIPLKNSNLSNVNRVTNNSPNPDNHNGKPLVKNERIANVFSWWQNKSLRFKMTATAIALGVVPIFVVGTIISIAVDNSFRAKIEKSERGETRFISNTIATKLQETYLDAKSIAESFEESADFANKNKAKLTEQLNVIKNTYKFYDSLALFDAKGDVIAQTEGKPLPNHFNRVYIQEALANKGVSISQPLISKTDGVFAVYVVSVIQNPQTKANLGFLRLRIPVKNLGKILTDAYQGDGKAVYLTDADNKLFFSTQGELQNGNLTSGEQTNVNPKLESLNIEKVFPKFQWETKSEEPQSFVDYNRIHKQQQLVAYKPLKIDLDNIQLDWTVIISEDLNIALAPVHRILSYIFLGIVVSGAVVCYIAYLLAQKLINPLEKTTETVKKIGAGNLDLQVEVIGNDEIAVLGKNINEMTTQLRNLVVEQELLASQSSLLKNMTLEMTKAFNISEVFEIAVTEIRQALQSDRVVVYSFDQEWKGTIIAESVDRNYPQALGARILDPCFADKYVEKYIEGRVQATPDIYKAGLTECHLKQLEPFAVKANLVAPIVANGKLLGLLIAHQCSAPRNWELNEIEFFSQTATQMGPALERVMLMQSQQLDAFLSTKLKDISFRIAESLTKDKIFEVATNMGREALRTDRMIIYTFDQDWKGTIIVESVDPKYPKSLGANIKDPCFADKYVDKYKQGRVQATNNIYTAGLTSCHIQQLEPFEVKANLVTPVIVEGNLLGLLIAHQCDAPRQWTESESIFLSQLATQIGPALERIQLLAKQQKSELEQRQAREVIQQRALELLMQVDPVSQGDLTIRATVTEDEIGTIADSYNATIESLRKIVTQVQGGTKAVTDVVNEQEAFVANLAIEVIRQTDDINTALEKIQTFAFSARMVLDNAEQAEEAVKQANRSVEEGEVAMNRTVDGILAIRETVAETAKKVKRLGESTQKISKVVNLIGSFADQTNLLALNASIEAAHAGEEGRGFAVVAEEVRSLARQSAEATAEIEKVVAEIQEETNDVVKAMESGTEQVVEGTRLVEETRSSLTNITAASAQINQLVTAIAAAAAEQSQTTEDITETMADVAIISNETSTAVTQVSRTFKKLLKVSENLQQSVSKFKVS